MRALVVCLMGVALVVSGCSKSGPPTQTVTITQDSANQVDIQWSSVPNTVSYQVLIDDTPSFRQPIFSQTVSQSSVRLDIFDAGLAPGFQYYVSISPSGAQTTFRLNVQAWPEAYLAYAYARAAWSSTGRSWLSRFSGVNWNERTQTWALNSSWPDASSNVAQDAYYTEYMARAAVTMGSVRNDLALLNELAQFYVAYEGRFTTVGAMRGMTQYDTSMLSDSGPDSTKTLIWVWVTGGTTFVRECDLCNSEFYHPATRLLRIITTLQPSERTQAMRDFTSWYAPLVTHDHLLRLLWGNGDALVDQYRNSPNYISDRDLWLIAGAAEILGANANDPNVVPLTSKEKSQLQQAVQIAVQALQMDYRTYYSDTRDFQGTVVGSVSYFNGEYRNDPDYAYSGYTGQAFPIPSDAKVQQDASWDISHFYRVPVFLRSLYDNRKATGVSFPPSEIELVVNQLMYKNFQGSFAFPLFNNYFDGSNGWYRVGYHGVSNFGYPPAQYCNNFSDVGTYHEPCLIPNAAVQGWGLIAFFSADLTELQHALANLAWSQDPNQIRFRHQYYYYNGLDYSALDSQGRAQFPTLLFWLLSGTAERLQ